MTDITKIAMKRMEKVLPNIDKLYEGKPEPTSNGLLNRTSRGKPVSNKLLNEPALIAAYYVNKFRKMRKELNNE